MWLGEAYQHADRKAKKHVPVIEVDGSVKADEMFKVDVSIGKEIAHPKATGSIPVRPTTHISAV